MRIVFFLLPLGLQSTLGEQAEQPVFNGDCHPRWPFLPGSILPFLLPSRLQSRQPKKITPGELSASPPLEGWMVGYDSLSLSLSLPSYSPRAAPMGWDDGDGDGRDEWEILRVEAQRTLFISHSVSPFALWRAMAPTGSRFAGLASLPYSLAGGTGGRGRWPRW